MKIKGCTKRCSFFSDHCVIPV